MTTIGEYYNWITYELTDPRVKDWPFMGSPVTILTVLIAYLYVIYNAGPKYMENKKPYNLKNIIAGYNVFQIVANSAIFYSILTSGWLTTYSLGCFATDYSSDPEPLQMVTTLWYLFMLKVADLIETVFFVLRKKQRQISFLHVYHHTSTIMLAWIGAKYLGGGMATFSVLCNCFIHVLMYSYYLAALGGDNIQKHLQKWKKNLTTLQMIQFVIIFAHALQALQPSCPVPRNLLWIFMPNMILVFYLFYDFYNKNYTPKSKSE